MWGYVLCKIIGIFFVPFLMIRRTEFLFDGWLRLYCGFLVYGIIARANLILVVLSIKTFFGWDGYVIDTGFTMQWDITNFADIMGLTCYVGVGFLSLFCTGRFAATVVIGTAGIGGAINNAAGVVTRMISVNSRMK
jgi:type IV secretory pathway VirB6-like protein